MNKIDEILDKANNLYRVGEDSGMSDAVYDELYNLSSPEFKSRIGYKVEKEVAKLPIRMASLDKVKTIEEILKWSKGVQELIITPKYDGISVLVEIVNGIPVKAYTRGDGIEGRDITDLLKGSGIFKNPSGAIADKSLNCYIAGELIMRKSTFNTKYSTEYKNPRNLVAGIFNKVEVSEMIKDVSAVFYRVYDKNGNLVFKDWSSIVKTYNDVYRTSLLIAPTTSYLSIHDIFDKHLKYITPADFEVDGHVITYSEEKDCLEAGVSETTGNPKYAVAYKPATEDSVVTTIHGIVWQMGKNGKMAPVIEVNPVDHCGVTISRVYAANAKAVVENGYGKGAVITLVRSGGVIPYITGVVHRSQEANLLPENCPFCASTLEYSTTEVDLFCPNQDCHGIKEAKLNHFIKTMDIENIGPVSVSNLYRVGVSNYVDLCNADLDTFRAAIGGVMAERAYNSVKEKLQNVKKAVFMHATDCFPSLGDVKLNGIKEMIMSDNLCERDLLMVDGIAETSAKVILDGVNTYKNNLSKITEISFKNESTVKDGIFSGKVFVFTGIRDSNMEERIRILGGQVSNTLNKNTSVLICKDANSGSGKTIKAKSYGTEIVSYDEMVKRIGEVITIENPSVPEREADILSSLL